MTTSFDIFLFQARRSVRWLRLVSFVAGAVCALAAEPRWDINVVGDISEAGRRITPPSRAHPTYFVPVVIGFREEGEIHAGDQPPPPKEAVLLELTKALAVQGYRSVGAATPEPSLLLTFSWGALNPIIENAAVETPSLVPGQAAGTTDVKQIANLPVMTALVVGNTGENLRASVPDFMTDPDREAAHEAISEDRYFVSVVAFDWAAVKAKKKLILWSTKISVRSEHATLAAVMPALIKSGAPYFGHETTRPKLITVPAAPEGRVEIGTPRVVPVPDANGGKS